MNKELYAIDGSTLDIMIDNTLTDNDRRVLSSLYQPIIKSKALSIFLTLHSLVNSSMESDPIKHHSLLNMLGLSSNEFYEERIKLEAVGLLDVFYKDNIYIYVLKSVLTPYEFFQNPELVQALRLSMNDNDFEKLKYEFILRKLDPSKFEKITTSFDEVYDIIKSTDTIVGVDTTNHGIVVNNPNFNIEEYLILVDNKIVSDKYLTSQVFLDKIKRLAFLFGLTPKELADATIIAARADMTIDEKVLISQVENLYDEKYNQTPLKVVSKASQEVDNKLINYLENTSPKDVVLNLTHTNLSGSEVAMFDDLLEKTGISIGLLNHIIIKILKDKDGEIVSRAYYLKVINNYKRKNISTAAQALDYDNNRKPSGHSQKVVNSPWKDTNNERNKKNDQNQEKPKNEVGDFDDFFN